MLQQGILSKCATWSVMAEEATEAYKQIDEIARVSDEAGIGKRVVRLVPIAVMKG
jgi:tRNA-splicing ligase RtcB